MGIWDFCPPICRAVGYCPQNAERDMEDYDWPVTTMQNFMPIGCFAGKKSLNKLTGQTTISKLYTLQPHYRMTGTVIYYKQTKVRKNCSKYVFCAAKRHIETVAFHQFDEFLRRLMLSFWIVSTHWQWQTVERNILLIQPIYRLCFVLLPCPKVKFDLSFFHCTHVHSYMTNNYF